MRIWLGPALLALAITACGGRTSDPPTQGPVAPGQDCPEPGATSPADDGCNSCVCENGSWSCTVKDCEPACEDGTKKAAGDGCNTCSCDDGFWLCTQKACPEPECSAVLGPPDAPCGENAPLFARTPGTDACCVRCSKVSGYVYYDTMEACEASKTCTPGKTKNADDDCNTCTCTADGEWACTDSSCHLGPCGGLNGGDCAEDEYCAYDTTKYDCRAADLSAVCRQRPTECTEEDAPVCGCDGKTYSNACMAGMLGDWGIWHDGACECEHGEVMGDDCTSCVCGWGVWQCDDLCVMYCASDTVKSAGDGCNTCTCMNNEWACSDLACPEPACPVPDGSPEPPCASDTLFGRAEGTDACCELCGTYPGYRYYESLEACEGSKVCSYGDTRLANDGCDTCGCTTEGEWFCGVSTCEPTLCGPDGDICWEDEYCAYEAGTEGCVEGAEGASCQPRPTECTEEEALVCSCDGLTHTNACMAAMAGVGVLSDGPCQ